MIFVKNYSLYDDGKVRANVTFQTNNTEDALELKIVSVEMIYDYASPPRDGTTNQTKFTIGSWSMTISASVAGFNTVVKRTRDIGETVLTVQKQDTAQEISVPVSLGTLTTNKVGGSIPMHDEDPIVITVGKKGIRTDIECGFDELNRIYYDFTITDGVIGSTYKIDTVLYGYYDDAYHELAVSRNQYRELVINELPYHERVYLENGISFPRNLFWVFWLRFMNIEDSEDTVEGSCYSNIIDTRLKVHVNGEAPEISQNGKAYATAEYYKPSTSSWVKINSPAGFDCALAGDGFDMYLPIPAKDMTITQGATLDFSARVNIRWDSYQKQIVPSHEAFFNTSRHMNYSNGLANNVFLGGTNAKNYTSRVWYSYVNNPLYFPDTNYIEVGSNDTAVMGLVKIGEYLGIVKQGKTTDTSIYIAYPTTFDDNTAYAVKPTTNGIGACAKYCFNVLGDETLFLSNEGVMAITPRTESGDEVKNRSYFIDGKLFDEPNLHEAYSFVWKGFYLLAVPNKEDNGHVYLLDGNQHNSWGNDKTNLVYECYFWNNVPAKQFARFKERLWFTDGNNMCRFKVESEYKPYNDNGEAIKAEWSTILDDDGSAYYYKNLKKKGSMLSLLPSGRGTSCEVYFRVDDGVEQYIGEVNSDVTEMPVDFFFNKKLKKYKRLQIIAKNEVPDQGFGIDQIVKLYTLGTYSK